MLPGPLRSSLCTVRRISHEKVKPRIPLRIHGNSAIPCHSPGTGPGERDYRKNGFLHGPVQRDQPLGRIDAIHVPGSQIFGRFEIRQQQEPRLLAETFLIEIHAQLGQPLFRALIRQEQVRVIQELYAQDLDPAHQPDEHQAHLLEIDAAAKAHLLDPEQWDFELRLHDQGAAHIHCDAKEQHYLEIRFILYHEKEHHRLERNQPPRAQHDPPARIKRYQPA